MVLSVVILHRYLTYVCNLSNDIYNSGTHFISVNSTICPLESTMLHLIICRVFKRGDTV